MPNLAIMTSFCPDWTLDEIIVAMKKHGYTGLEPRIEWNHASGIEISLSPKERKEHRDQMESEGLQFCAIATGVRMAEANRETRSQHIDTLRQAIDLAADLGAPYIRTFGGEFDTSIELSPVIDYVVEGYHQVLEYADQRNVTLLMEVHDAWCHSAPVRAVIERANHKRLAALWDMMHPMRKQEKPQETFSNLGQHTHHVHIHDAVYNEEGKLKITPLGEGLFDHVEPINLLLQTGYDGYYSLEVIQSRGEQKESDGVMQQHGEKLREIINQA